MKNSLRKVVLAVLLLVSISAGGFARADTNDKLKQANSAFSALDFEGALKILEQAFSQAGNGRQELIRIYSLGALCLVSLGREQEAKRSFEAVLSIDPSYRLDKDASPRFQKPFFEVLKKKVPRLAINVSLPSPLIYKKPVSIEVSLLADPAQISKKLIFHYKHEGQKKFSSFSIMLKPKQTKSFYLPPGFWEGFDQQSLLWYAQLKNRFGGTLLTKGSVDHPVVVDLVKPTPKPLSALEDISGRKAPPEAKESSWYEHWWVWAIVGGAAAAIAGGSAAAVYLGSDDPKQRNFTLDIR